MKQGTISVLVGVHSVIHSLLVLRSWRTLYGSWPKPWQVVCIFIHDIGHWGTDYLNDESEKRLHWIGGSVLAARLFGPKGFNLVAGHTGSSGGERSVLYKPDKYSWYIAPYWWLWLNTFTEPKIAMGYSRDEAIRRFRQQVKLSIESGEYRSSHSMYLERCKGVDDGEV